MIQFGRARFADMAELRAWLFDRPAADDGHECWRLLEQDRTYFMMLQWKQVQV